MNVSHLDNIVAQFRPHVNRSLIITKQEYKERWKRVQHAMRAKGYDLAYACGSELDRSDVAWLAGVFDPIIERYGVLIPSSGKPVAIAGSEGGHVIAECIKASGANLALLQEFQISDEDYRFARFEKLEDVVRRIVPLEPGKQIKIAIFSSSQFIPYDHVELFTGRFGAENVNFDTELLQRIKYEKSLKELQIVGVANIIADAAFLGMLSMLKNGVRELDVAAAGDYIMKKLGAGRTGFPTIVSSGTRGRSVLGPATNRMIRRGEFVSLGISPAFNGYHGIMRRTAKVGTELTRGEKSFMGALEGLYHTVFMAAEKSAISNSPANRIDKKGKEYIARKKLKTLDGKRISPREPYTFIHNTGCSECQEGFGAVTPYTSEPLGKNVALMIDVAFMGFDANGKLAFPIEYAVIEDCFWKKGKNIGVYNKIPLNVQVLTGKKLTSIPKNNTNPYYKKIEEAE